MQRQLPGLDRAQGQWQTSGLGKGMFILAIKTGLSQSFDQATIGVSGSVVGDYRGDRFWPGEVGKSWFGPAIGF